MFHPTLVSSFFFFCVFLDPQEGGGEGRQESDEPTSSISVPWGMDVTSRVNQQ
jgi:hypothetical protein